MAVNYGNFKFSLSLELLHDKGATSYFQAGATCQKLGPWGDSATIMVAAGLDDGS